MVLPPHLVDAVTDVKLHSDHHTESIGQLALTEMITSHAYDRHVRACRLRYRRRRDQLLDRLGARGNVRGIAAGLHALVDVADEAEVLARAEKEGLAVGHLGEHWHERGEGRPQGLVVGYGTPRERIYPEALEALGRVLDGSRRVSGRVLDGNQGVSGRVLDGNQGVSGGSQLGRKKA
jgi:GntR family transcriptional regulator/MocR family aminotransferase